ncbi:MAG: hypothetical protein CSB47_11500 [Proteobacteria bacterium]|nr:MAG: hypothetical protein CSB47_11500 [Pseudomonadota bacterium]
MCSNSAGLTFSMIVFGMLLSVTVGAVSLSTEILVPRYEAGEDVSMRNFEGADLTLANFSLSNASGSSFLNARLDYANLSLANFQNTNLTNTSFKWALIEYTDFTGAEGLTAEQLQEACLTHPEQEEKLGVADFNAADYRMPAACRLWEHVPRG